MKRSDWLMLLFAVSSAACAAAGMTPRQDPSSAGSVPETSYNELHEFGIPEECLRQRAAAGIVEMALSYQVPYDEVAAGIFATLKDMERVDGGRQLVIDAFCGRVAVGMLPSMARIARGVPVEASAEADASNQRWRYRDGTVIVIRDGVVVSIIPPDDE